MVVESAADAERWAQARALLEGGEDPAAQQRATQRTRRRVVVVLVAVLVGAGAAGFLHGLLGPDDPTAGPPQESWAQVIGGTAAWFAGLSLFAVGAAQGWRNLRRLGGLRGPAAVLTRTQQKQLIAEVRGKREVDPAHLPLARNLAERSMALLRPIVLLFVGLSLLGLAQWISSPPSFRFVTNAVAAVMFGIACVLALWEARRARAFLAAHPADDA